MTPEGKLVDITPKIIPFSEILFIRDEKAILTGNQVDNIRINTSGNQLVDEYIALAEVKFFLLNDGEKAEMQNVTLTDNDAEIFKYVTAMMFAIEAMLLKAAGRNSACFCGSNVKYKHCHGKDLISYLNSIKA